MSLRVAKLLVLALLLSITITDAVKFAGDTCTKSKKECLPVKGRAGCECKDNKCTAKCMAGGKPKVASVKKATKAITKETAIKPTLYDGQKCKKQAECMKKVESKTWGCGCKLGTDGSGKCQGPNCKLDPKKLINAAIKKKKTAMETVKKEAIKTKGAAKKIVTKAASTGDLLKTKSTKQLKKAADEAIKKKKTAMETVKKEAIKTKGTAKKAITKAASTGDLLKTKSTKQLKKVASMPNLKKKGPRIKCSKKGPRKKCPDGCKCFRGKCRGLRPNAKCHEYSAQFGDFGDELYGEEYEYDEYNDGMYDDEYDNELYDEAYDEEIYDEEELYDNGMYDEGEVYDNEMNYDGMTGFSVMFISMITLCICGVFCIGISVIMGVCGWYVGKYVSLYSEKDDYKMIQRDSVTDVEQNNS